MLQILIYKPVIGLIQLLIMIILALGRGLITLVKFVFKIVLFILKIILVPLQKIMMLFWKLLPKGIKKTVDKLYNKTAGNLKEIRNYINKWLDKWKRKKE